MFSWVVKPLYFKLDGKNVQVVKAFVALRHSCNLTSWFLSYDLVDQYITGCHLHSNGNLCSFLWHSLIILTKGSKCRVKSIGPNTEPCRTQWLTFVWKCHYMNKLEFIWLVWPQPLIPMTCSSVWDFYMTFVFSGGFLCFKMHAIQKLRENSSKMFHVWQLIWGSVLHNYPNHFHWEGTNHLVFVK